MSKSLKRVEADAAARGLSIAIIHTPNGTHTAALAAEFCGCDVAQIAKSILLRLGASDADELAMFITSGANRVHPGRAAALVGAPLFKADADIVRRVTGFAIGGVAPIGALHAIPAYFDRDLLKFDRVFAAAGTPQHLFAVDPRALVSATGAMIADFT